MKKNISQYNELDYLNWKLKSEKIVWPALASQCGWIDVWKQYIIQLEWIFERDLHESEQAVCRRL